MDSQDVSLFVPAAVDLLALTTRESSSLETNAETEFGARVRAYRRSLNLSQFGLNRTSGLHHSFISHVERGKVNPTLRSMLLLAKGLGVDLSDLVRDLPPPRAARKGS